MKTLYLTDLDGTLLRDDEQVSPFSVSVLNRAIEQGILFSVATARSLIGLNMLPLGGIRFRTPMVLMNGVMLYDYAQKRILQRCEMDGDTVAAILRLCAEEGKTPFLYHAAGDEVHAQFTVLTSEGERRFYKSRSARFSHLFHPVERYADGPAVYFSMQDSHGRLARLQRRLTALPAVASTLYKDNYMEDNWYLEIFSAEAGKDKGAKRLQALTGADRLVAFGDNLNDLPLFACADTACCVASGREAAKEAADVLIGGNNEDGVAQYMAALLEGEDT